MTGALSILVLSTHFAERAKMVGSSTLYEALGLLARSTRRSAPVWTGALIAAPAYPLACSLGDNLSNHLVVEHDRVGSVLVVATGDFVAGYCGEVLTVAAGAAGIVGLVIDGGVRDVAALTSQRFSVFARRISMRG